MLHLTSLAVLITTLRVGIAANDPYFNTTVLLLNGDVTPFTDDASTNKFALNPFGAPRATTFNPYQEGYYSGLFNGTSTSVNPATIPIASTGAFTIEGWIYSTSSALQCIYSQYASAGVDPGRMNLLFNDPAGKISIFTGATGSTGTLTSTSSPPLNTWTHFALVRDGSNVAKIYINGILDATNATFTTTIMQTTAYIGYTAASPGYGFYGYISNFRITNTAVYTGNFTVPTLPLTATQSSSGNIAAITGTATRLLTLQSSWFKDNSTNTVTGSNTIISGYQPFILPSLYSSYGSGLFNGSSDYFTVTKTGGWLTSGGNFTVEYWAYLTSYPSSSSGNYIAVTFGTSGASNGWEQGFGGTASSYTSYYFAFKGAGSVSATYSFLLNRWYHIAVVKNSSTTTAYINGVSSGTSTNITTWTDNAGMNIGLLGVASYPYWYPGYISNMRIVNGTAVYTGAFTTPTAPLSRIQSSGTNIAALTGTETVLLTLQNNQSQNNNQFRDSSSSNFTITRSGTPTQGTFTPFSQTGWSGYFDGVGGTNINLASNGAFALGTGQYFIQAFCYPLSGHSSASGNTGHGIISQGNNANNLLWAMSIDPTTGTIFWGLTGAGVTTSVSYPVLFNSWNHIAVSRDASNIERIFLNGRLINQRSNTTNFNGVSDYATRIGSYYDSNYPSAYGMNAYGQVFYGYISNIQMVVGNIPTYFQTASITPGANIFVTPIAPATVVTGTVLLTLQNNYFKDNSANAFAIVRSGSPKIQAFSPFAPTAAYSTTLVGGSMYFNGTSDYLTSPSPSNLSMGTSDFTWDMWVYPTGSISTNAMLFGYRSGSDNSPYVYYTTSQLFFTGDTTNFLTYNGVPPIGVWTHIAVSRAGSSLKMFINGAVVVTATNSTNFSDASVRYVGAINGGNFYYFPGYLSNLRIVKGLAVYTSAFTPPTAPLAASISVTTISQVGVDFLVVAGGGSGGYCGNGAGGGGGGAGGVRPGASVVMASNVSYTIIVGGGGSSSASGTNSSFHTYTALGGGRGGGWDQASLITSTSGGSGGGAGYGNGTAYSATSATAPELGNRGGSGVSAGPYPGGGGGGAGAVGGDAPSSSVGGAGGAGYTSAIAGSSSIYGGGGGAGIYGGTAGAGGTGGGGAGVASSGTGFSGTANTGGGGGGSTASGFYGSPGGTGGSGIVIIRYSVDSPAALSTTNATMTLSGGYRIYTWITSGNITFDTFATGVSTTATTQSSLLLSGTNAGIQDATGKNTLTTVGDVRVSTAVKKYSTGAMYFDGTGDYINCEYSPQFDFGTGDFTVECWVYTTSYATAQGLFESRVQANVVEANRLIISILVTSGYPQLYNASNDVAVISTIAIPLNTWTHVAFTRNSGTARVFVNGQVGATNASFTTNFLVNKLVIGAWIQVSGGGVYNRNFFNGYIDDYRITKGVARYTANFAPPSAALPVL